MKPTHHVDDCLIKRFLALPVVLKSQVRCTIRIMQMKNSINISMYTTLPRLKYFSRFILV